MHNSNSHKTFLLLSWLYFVCYKHKKISFFTKNKVRKENKSLQLLSQRFVQKSIHTSVLKSFVSENRIYCSLLERETKKEVVQKWQVQLLCIARMTLILIELHSKVEYFVRVNSFVGFQQRKYGNKRCEAKGMGLSIAIGFFLLWQ